MNKTLYEGFLVVEYAPGVDARAYRNMNYYTMNVPTYSAKTPAGVYFRIRASEEQGEFSEEQFEDIGIPALGSTVSAVVWTANVEAHGLVVEGETEDEAIEAARAFITDSQSHLFAVTVKRET